MSAVTIVINSNGMGKADSVLSHKLAASFLNMLDLDDKLPGTICFYAEGREAGREGFACAGGAGVAGGQGRQAHRLHDLPEPLQHPGRPGRG